MGYLGDLWRARRRAAWPRLSTRASRLLWGSALALLVLGLFAPYLFTAKPVVLSLAGEDVDQQYLAWRTFGFAELAVGRLPFWNPFIYGGAPYFAGFQSALLYPVNWLHLFLPTPLAINWEIAAHVLLAGLFMYLWASGRGLGARAAFVSAVTFAFCGPFFAHVMPGHLSNLATMAWTPLILLALDKIIVEGAYWPWVVTGAVGYALHLLAGHPQYAYYFGLMAVPYGLMRLAVVGDRGRKLLAVAAVPALGGLLAGVQLIPGFRILGETLRGAPSYTFASSFPFRVESLWLAISPGRLGGLDGGRYLGPYNFWEQVPYLGIVALALALTALILVRRARPLGAMAALALVLALGNQVPALYQFLYRHLPYFASFRGTSKFIYVVALYGAMLAGHGFAALVRPGGTLRRRSRWALIPICGLLAGLGVAWILPALPPRVMLHPLLEPRQAWFELGAILLAAAVILGGRRRAACGTALALLVVWDGLHFAGAVLRSHAVGDRLAAAKPAAADEPDVGAPRILSKQGEENSGMIARTPAVLGDDPFPLRRYMELLGVTQGVSPKDVDQALAIVDRRHPLLRLVRLKGLEPVLPEFYLVPRYEVRHPGAEVLQALADPGFKPEEVAILETQPSVVPADQTGAPAPSVRVSRRAPGTAELEVETATGGVLVSSIPFATGWQASSVRGDAPAGEVVPVDHAFLGMVLPAGHHQIRLEYRPPGLALGAWLSLLGLGLCGAVGLVTRRYAGGHAWRGPALELSLPVRPALAALALAAGIAAILYGQGRSARFGATIDPELGWRQPFRDQGGLPNGELSPPPTAELKGRFIVLGNQYVRAGELPWAETFAGALGMFNAGLDEASIYQQAAVYERFLRRASPAGLVLVVTPYDLMSRAESEILASDPERYLLAGDEHPGLVDYRARLSHRFRVSDLPGPVWGDWTAAVRSLKASVGAAFKLVFMPTAKWLRKGGGPELGQHIGTWARGEGIDYLDLTPLLTANRADAFVYIAVDQLRAKAVRKGVLSPIGHHLIAAEIATLVRGSDPGANPSVSAPGAPYSSWNPGPPKALLQL